MSITDLSAETTLALVLGLHSCVGVTGALIAYYKGRSLPLWLLIGLLTGTAAFFVALVMKRQPRL